MPTAQQAAQEIDPVAGLQATAELRRIVETLEQAQVERALAHGLSWNEIGTHLGVTRQAVHKKYARRLRRPPP